MPDQSEANGKLWALIQPIRFAMMTTDDGGTLRARPMAAVDAEFDGTLWFFTHASSHKVAEIAEDERVGLSYADPAHQIYVSLSGRATVVRDADAIARHWHESLRTWFPNGQSDPDVALLRVSVEQGEYWDAPSSTMLHLYGYISSLVTDRPPNVGDHGTVSVSDRSAAD